MAQVPSVLPPRPPQRARVSSDPPTLVAHSALVEGSLVKTNPHRLLLEQRQVSMNTSAVSESNSLLLSPTATGQDGAVTTAVTTGTASPPYSVYSEKDPSSSVALQYQTITAMPAYRGTSLEELRMQDYQQGRKTAGAFGQTSFGTPAAQPTGIFGATTQQPATSSIFGGGTTGAFGTGTSQQPGTGTFGGFGQPSLPAGGTGTGLFGGTSAFGQPQQQPQQPQQQQPPAFGAFGQQTQQQPSTGGGIFGGGGGFGQNKPTTGFGLGTSKCTTYG
ncbi:hypothetical protein M404DRAFT_677694 [Pisolithus tinctorius Marx 270]|uniref:Uncharacterized protein n=1 Tax=Pisolithus tinctorius Marx 270 TaxID=870435 RepID=A0A0C3JTJ0_PISTI|nr:hypothetical protein M404DRAFT_677694 [Pisolithus tinctorius Marx 270]